MGETEETAEKKTDEAKHLSAQKGTESKAHLKTLANERRRNMT